MSHWFSDLERTPKLIVEFRAVITSNTPSPRRYTRQNHVFVATTANLECFLRPSNPSSFKTALQCWTPVTYMQQQISTSWDHLRRSSVLRRKWSSRRRSQKRRPPSSVRVNPTQMATRLTRRTGTIQISVSLFKLRSRHVTSQVAPK